MNCAYNQVNFGNEQIGSNSVNTFIDNDTNSFKNYQKIPITSSLRKIINSSMNGKDINLEDNSFSKQISYYSFLPEIKKDKISMTEILSNYNYDNKEYPSSYEESCSNPIISERENNYRARSPVTRKNNFLLNNEKYIMSSLNSKSPLPSINKEKSNNYNIISSYIPNRTFTSQNNSINNIQSNNPNYYFLETNIPSTLDYSNYNINNKDNIKINKEISQFSNIITNKDFPINNNAITYYTFYPNSSSEILTYQIIPQTFQTIKYIPNSNNANNNYIISPLNNNEKYKIINYMTPLKENKSISYPFNSINTVPTTNKNNQMALLYPHNLNINSIPSHSNRLITNYSYQNTITPNETTYDRINNFNNNNLKNNDYKNYVNSHYLPLNNNLYKIERQNTFPIVSKFNVNYLKNQRNVSPSFNNSTNSKAKENNYSKGIDKHNKKKYEKSQNSNSSNNETKDEIKNLIFSKAKKYANKNLGNSSNDAKSVEEINTNINNINNKSDKDIALNKKYTIKSNLIKSENMEIVPDEYFSQYMFSNINKIRTDPKSFISEIKNAIKNISHDKNGKFIYKEKLKVSLFKGKKSFEEAISCLETIKPMKPLVFKDELCVDISNNEKEFTSGDYLREKIKEKINSGISISAFWRDIIKDPKINFLLMIIDDNAIKRGDKRKDILDPEMKYIGINSASLGNKFVCYTVLSCK